VAGTGTGAGSIEVVPEPGAAVEMAIARADGPVVVAGSLYLVGAARAMLVDDPDLRDPDPGDPAPDRGAGRTIAP
jgi:hypothetical protein